MAIKHLFIVNPKAGKRNRFEGITAAVHKLGLTDEHEIIETERKGHATELVSAHAANWDGELRVYSCGGDGTLGEVVRGAYGNPNCAVGIIPIGSGNDFVRSFDGYTRTDFLNIKAAVNGTDTAIDVLHVGDKIGINILSVGYDAAVAMKMDKFKNLPLVSGSMAYKLSAAQCLLSEMKHKMVLFADGEEVIAEHSSYLFAIAANGKYYGGGFKASPISDLSDGLMDLITVPTVSRLKFLRLIGKFRKGEHLDYPFVHHQTCKTLKITANEPINVNIDGDIFEMSDPVISVEKQALRILLPCKRNQTDEIDSV